ncbi:hypothetical protein OG322_27645 [Streptomyces sp. NBC_01260]|uniref:hypothetical protein n=1 Tax=Streptomyces sp. NBC_01260 TaxID=2903801 RepID=UPI002E36CE61|nr:hypothetical protein [Streptomyces sp. NBC_01260]
MNEIWVGLVTLVGGYYAHVLQETYTRKKQRQDDDRALMKDLHMRLVELRDSELEGREVARAATALESEAAFLQHAKLRMRVTEDLHDLGTIWFLPLGGGSARDRQNVWIQDALDALAAIARGGRLPQRSDDFNDQLFLTQRASKGVSASLDSLLEALRSDPEVDTLLTERTEWEARRRAQRGWRRFVPRRKPRSEVTAGQEVGHQPG